MTSYLGSKANHADELLKIMLAKRRPGQAWVEPFVGGANVICRVPDADGPRIGADINPYMVALHTALGNGWDPPSNMDEKTYNAIKKYPDKYQKELVAFAATSLSFGKIGFSSFARDGHGGTLRNYCAEGRRLALKDAIGIRGAKFIVSSYDQLDIPPQSLIYCDPPYIGTTGYVAEHQDQWRAYKFWQWADKKVDEGHTVFVSEYTGPSPECYAKPPRTAEHDLAMQSFRALQAKLQTMETTPPDIAQSLEDLGAEIKAHENSQREFCVAMVARWKVIWKKEVKVHGAANATVAKGDVAKTATEKLFYREV